MSLAATLLSTLGLAVIFWKRGPGLDRIYNTLLLLYGCVVYGLVWISAGFLLYELHPGRLILLHAAYGAIGLLGVVGVTGHRDEWWVRPAATLTLAYPLVLCALRLSPQTFPR